MFITVCAACAAPLAHNAPRCIRCQTRYCDATCQHDHWRRGHKQNCKKIFRHGGAEKCLADLKYKEAEADAIKSCANTVQEGAECYICHSPSTEGLVRGCECSGKVGFAHISCLMRQAQIAVDDDESMGKTNMFNLQAYQTRWMRWQHCRLCGHEFQGQVMHALGWACWKSYVNRPEADRLKRWALECLGRGLMAGNRSRAALLAFQSSSDLLRRFGSAAEKRGSSPADAFIPICLSSLGRHEEALAFRKKSYLHSKQIGDNSEEALNFASCLCMELVRNQKYDEARQMQRETFPRLRRVFGHEDCRVLSSRAVGARILYEHPNASLEEAQEGVTSLEKIARTTERLLPKCTDPTQMSMLPTLLDYVRDDLIPLARAKVAQLSAPAPEPEPPSRETPPDELDEVEDAD